MSGHAQLFSPRATLAFRLTLIGTTLALIGVLAMAYVYVRSGSYWNVGRPADQPIPFRHDVHAGALGTDCRFCHTAVERHARAGMPTSSTCMTCHSRIWQAASLLEPMRTSVALGQSIHWSSVHRLPSHVHFHHGIHVSRGIGCVTCHGAVSKMPRTVKAETLSMSWCLQCHRNEAAARTGAADSSSAGSAKSSAVGTASLLTNCSTCHR